MALRGRWSTTAASEDSLSVPFVLLCELMRRGTAWCVRACESATQVNGPWAWLEDVQYVHFEMAVKKNFIMVFR